MQRYRLAPAAALALLFAATGAAHADTTTTPPATTYALTRAGTTIAAGLASTDACIAAAKADTEALRASQAYACGPALTFATTYTPPCPAQPENDAQIAACPAGTKGSWAQSRSYSSVPYPACWAAGTWAPGAAPDGACTPVGGFDATGMPRVDLAKIPVVDPAQKYTAERMAALALNPDGTVANPSVFYSYQNLGTIGAFREACGYAGMNGDDALVFPGKPGASHLHSYFGVFADAFTTSAGILDAAWSSCAGGLLNRTAYWMPALIDTRDGTPLKPTSNNVYYKGSYRFPKFNRFTAVPSGLHLITGDATNTDPAKGRGRFICIGPNGENPGWKSTLAAAFADGTCAGTGRSELIAEIDFPICWDGVNLDSPDHKAHVIGAEQYKLTDASGKDSYPWRCPPAHPVVLPTISYNIHYAIPDAQAVGRWYLSSDHYPAPAGSSAHADYFFGWKRETVDSFTTHCLNEQRDCHNYLLGDNVNRLY